MKNNFEILGRLIEDPKLIKDVSKAGKEYSYMSLFLETDIDYSEKYNETNTFSMKLFGKSSEKLTNAKKGDMVTVIGSIKSREWEGRYFIDFNPKSAELVESKARTKKDDSDMVYDNLPDEDEEDMQLPF